MNRNELANLLIEYSHTITSKITLAVGGTAAVSQTSAGSWIANSIDWFIAWPWMSTLSHVAIILLVIERGFIVWAHIRKSNRERNQDKSSS